MTKCGKGRKLITTGKERGLDINISERHGPGRGEVEMEVNAQGRVTAENLLLLSLYEV